MGGTLPSTREHGARAHRLGLVVNALLAVVKVLAGLIARSPALLADGYHSLADLATGGVAWASYRWATEPPDEDHHYGHGKAEAAAAFFVGLVLALGGVGVLWESLSSSVPAYEGLQGVLALSVAALSAGANAWLVRLMRTTAEELRSPSLAALVRDNASDVLTSLLTIVGVGASMAGQGWIEIVAAALIGLLIATMGAKSLKEGLDVLMDRVPDQQLRGRLRSVAEGVEGVRGVQRVDVHPLGSTVRVDMEISVDGDLPVRKGHEIAHEVGSAVTREEATVVEVAVHVNPAQKAAAGVEESG